MFELRRRPDFLELYGRLWDGLAAQFTGHQRPDANTRRETGAMELQQRGTERQECRRPPPTGTGRRLPPTGKNGRITERSESGPGQSRKAGCFTDFCSRSALPRRYLAGWQFVPEITGYQGITGQ